ncbi:uncharacterized protein (DUF305 family) [Amycolatopsis bartoniae]|uniref:DUF305 domain-containing protein n=1 Tax=Amycolatopsis bartoniae TaxID=941986 RepID=A0A8H9J0J5_9PSEU|nr:DUF305 domain-containing protein [Amycolatopsis bartoniae]MBB2938730.1 uncharacterized protein (DUF305 family) [Amycolatopsis bartoniae]TVT11489.1 DUF305 domain-containing protein [Amycolatopsis bartoniae]GHF79747.1 hypothetical protein GCM10017566_62430 [Amycolatopsis bartoniae]
MTRKTLVGTALAVLTLGTVLAGCSGNTSSDHDMASMTSSTSAPAGQQGNHNQADVAFAQEMIPHHQQAVTMAKLVPSRTINAKVIDLADRIQKAQDPEIQQMTGWLSTWGAAPATSSMNMPGMTDGQSMPGMSGSNPMPGMMSDADMTKLQGMQGAEFDRMWLQMMVQHHQGAIDMANTELTQGSSPEAKALAQKIITAQQAEITEMNGILGQS